MCCVLTLRPALPAGDDQTDQTKQHPSVTLRFGLVGGLIDQRSRVIRELLTPGLGLFYI